METKNRTCLIGEKYTNVIYELKENGFNAITLPINESLDDEVNNHADILAFKHNNNLFICSNIAGELKVNFDGYNVHTVQGIKSPYPDDCKLNVVVLGDLLVCNKNCVAPEISAYAKKNNLTIIHTNQGYTKCSLCVVNSNTVITEDPNLSSLLKNYQINVLEIQKGYVHLSDKHYGFIGGAGVKLSDGLIYFNGDLSSHPDYDRIIEFLNDFGVKPIFKKNRPLTDFGGFILI